MKPTISRRTWLQGTAVAAVSLAGVAAHGQSDYPDHPIRLVVPYPAGALTDSLGRLVADRLRPALGQPIVVENRPGAGTMLGASQVAKSPADGYNLMVATTTTFSISPAMFTQPAATAADFIGVAMIGSVSLVLVTRPDLPARNLGELVALLRAEPGRYNFASPANGSMHHLLVEMIKDQQKVQVTHVPYQGSMAALTDLLTGRTDFMFIDAVAGLPQIEAGKLNAIAVAAPKRLAALPDVPTVIETYPSVDPQAWQCIAAPRATPAAIVERLNAEINRQLGMPEVQTKLRQYGVETNPMSVADLNAFIVADAKRFAEVVRIAGLKPS